MPFTIGNVSEVLRAINHLLETYPEVERHGDFEEIVEWSTSALRYTWRNPKARMYWMGLVDTWVRADPRDKIESRSWPSRTGQIPDIKRFPLEIDLAEIRKALQVHRPSSLIERREELT